MVSRTAISSIIRGYRTQGLTHLPGRQSKYMCLIVRLLSKKADWWDAPFAIQELAEAIYIILTIELAHSSSMGAPLLSSSYHSYSYTRLHFHSDPIFKRFLHRHYQVLPPSHKSPLKRTCSTIPHTFTSLLPLDRYPVPASPQNLTSLFSRHKSIQPIKTDPRTQQW